MITTSSSRIVTNISVDRAYIVGLTPSLVDEYTMRERFGYSVELLHDVHERVPPMTAVRLAKELEKYRPFFLEDPLAPEDQEWFRLLRKGGVLLNFDASYADNVRNQNQSASCISPSGVYGHVGVTPELARENAEITLAMPAGVHERPRWDGELAREIGFSSWGAREDAGSRILRERDLSDAPLFLFWAVK